MTLSGFLTLETSLMMMDTQLQRAISDGIVHLVLDMTAVGYCGSAGLRLLVHTFGLMNAKGGSLRLCGIVPRIRELLQMTKMESFLTIDETRADSLAALAK